MPYSTYVSDADCELYTGLVYTSGITNPTNTASETFFGTSQYSEYGNFSSGTTHESATGVSPSPPFDTTTFNLYSNLLYSKEINQNSYFATASEGLTQNGYTSWYNSHGVTYFSNGSFYATATITTGVGAGQTVYNESTLSYNPAYIELFDTTYTEITDNNFITTQTQEFTYSGPLDESTKTYSKINSITTSYVFSSIKTTTLKDIRYIGDYISKTINFEHFGFDKNSQFLGLIYSSPTTLTNYSQYNSIIAEQDFASWSKTNIDISGYVVGSFEDPAQAETYTLTYNSFTQIPITITATYLDKSTVCTINSLQYGFAETKTASLNVFSTQTITKTKECESISVSQIGNWNQEETSDWFIVQNSTTLNSFYETTSTCLKYFSYTDNSFSYTNSPLSPSSYIYTYLTCSSYILTCKNQYIVAKQTAAQSESQINETLYPLPLFCNTGINLHTFTDISEVTTFYTEKAQFAFFASPSYVSAYTNYSDTNFTNVLICLIGLENTDEKFYPSYISVYNGSYTLSADRESSSISYPIIYQSSSSSTHNLTSISSTKFWSSGTQTTSSSATTTISIYGLASTFTRFNRTYAENLTSAYLESYFPQIPITGENVVFSENLQQAFSSDVTYNISNEMINAYTTNISTIANSSISSFPASISDANYPNNRKVRASMFLGMDCFGGLAEDTTVQELLRFKP